MRCATKGISRNLLYRTLRHGTLHAGRIGWLSAASAASSVHSQRRSLHLPNPFKRDRNHRPLDDVPTSHELVYRNTMNNYVVYAYAPIVGTTGAAFVAVAVTFWNNLLAPVPVFDQPLFFDNYWEMAIATPFLISAMFLTRLIADRCILRLYLDEERRRFVAVFATLLPWRVRKLEFAPGQMRLLYDAEQDEADEVAGNIPRGGPFRAIRGDYAIDRRRFIIYPEYFKMPYHYNFMMGYTK